MIHFGLLTAILDGWSFEEAVDTAAEMGFECLEVACWPAGKAERRYAGVSHIDAERVLEDNEYAEYVKKYISDKGMHISSLAYYPNVLDPNPEKSGPAIEHLKSLIKASAKLGVGMVTTFIGLDQRLQMLNSSLTLIEIGIHGVGIIGQGGDVHALTLNVVLDVGSVFVVFQNALGVDVADAGVAALGLARGPAGDFQALKAHLGGGVDGFLEAPAVQNGG